MEEETPNVTPRSSWLWGYTLVTQLPEISFGYWGTQADSIQRKFFLGNATLGGTSIQKFFEKGTYSSLYSQSREFSLGQVDTEGGTKVVTL